MGSSMFPWDSIFKDRRVIAGACALSRNGLTTISPGYLQVFTAEEDFDGFSFGVGMYIYRDPIDYDNFVTPMKTNSNLLLPSRERSVVEFILVDRWCDEGTLIEALKSYKQWEENYTKLYHAAEFYGLSEKKLKYWIREAETDVEI